MDNVEAFTSRFQLVFSSTWYNYHFPNSSGWDGWIQDTVKGVEYANRDPYFSGYIVITKEDCLCSRATATIARLAMQANKAVLHYDEKRIRSCRHLLNIDAESWIKSWLVQSSTIV